MRLKPAHAPRCNVQKDYSIHIYKQYLNFSAAHFIIFPDGTREPLHGHNYRLEMKAHLPALKDDMVFDFLHIKPLAREICNSLDHKLLLPAENPYINYNKNGSQLDLHLLSGEHFSFPQSDTLLLPLPNTSAERLAIYLAHTLQKKVESTFFFRFSRLQVEIEETPGQSAIYELIE